MGFDSRDKTGTSLIDETNHAIRSVSIAGTISTVGSVTNIVSVDLVDAVTTVTSVTAVVAVGTVSTVSSVTNVVSVDAVDTVASVTNVVSVDAVDTVSSVTAVTTVNTVTTLGSVTNIVSVDAVDTVSSITNVVSVDVVDTVAAVTAVATVNAVTTVGSVTNVAAISAGENHLGIVTGGGISISVTPAISAGAIYVAKEAVGGEMTFANAVRVAGGSGIINSVTIADNDGENAGLELWLFSATVAEAADNAPMDFTDAELLTCVGVIPISSADYFAIADNSVACLRGVGLQFKCAATSLFGQLKCTATPTYTAVGDLTVTSGIEYIS